MRAGFGCWGCDSLKEALGSKIRFRVPELSLGPGSLILKLTPVAVWGVRLLASPVSEFRHAGV